MTDQISIQVTETWLTQKPNSLGFQIGALLTLLLFLGSLLFWKNLYQAALWMPATQYLVFEKHEYWRAWTSLFVHANEKHLFSNSIFFFILGSFLNGYFGVILFPLLAFLMGGLVNLMVLSGMSPETELIGASGIVFWMGGSWLILYFFLDVKRSLYQRTIRSIGVALALFMPAEAFDPQISYKSHFIGFILGLFCGFIYYLIHRKKFDAAIQKIHIVENFHTQ